MLGVEKIKNRFKEAVMQHPFSMCLFMIGMIIWAVYESFPYSGSLGTVRKILEHITYSFCIVSAGMLLCESIHHFKKKDNEEYVLLSSRNKLIYGGIIAVSVLVAAFFCFISYSQNVKFDKDILDYRSKFMTEEATKVLICYLAAVLMLSVYFIYKRSGEAFETYVAKAFCGLMKAELVYLIIALGIMLVIFAFDVLIIGTDSIDLLERVEILLIGLVEYPCVIMGITRTDEKIGKFAKIVLSYVFTGLMAIAMTIIYIYIIKILVQWQFPKNQVFAILTALFAFGLPIWTMAKGCCDEMLKKPLSIMPFLFIPFIILQAMCLYMRVSDYGYTVSRYFGLALIVFEIMYFALYTFVFISGKDMIHMILFMVIATAFLTLLVPGVNVSSMITNSQKKKLEAYLREADPESAAAKRMLREASEAYRTIKDEGGITGNLYLNRLEGNEHLVAVKENKNSGSSDSGDTFYISIDNSAGSFDISGYTELVQITDAEGKSDNLSLLSYGEKVGVINLSSQIKSLAELYEDGYSGGDDEMKKVISGKFELDDGAALYITNLFMDGDMSDITDPGYISITGFLLK